MDYMDDASTWEQMIIKRAKKQKIPVSGSLELLPLCNMNCEMCYIRLSREKMEQVGRMRTKEEWLSLAEQMKQAGVLFLLLTGGEPLLFPDFREIYLELKKMGMVLTINTNGTLIDEKWADFFGRNKPRRINITLYGAGRTSYEKLCHYGEGFEKTIRAIQLLKEREVDVKVSCSVTQKNWEDREEIFALGEKLDVPVHMDHYMFPAAGDRNSSSSRQVRLFPKMAAKLALDALKMQFSEEIWKQYVKQSLERIEDPEFPRGDGKISCLAGNCSFIVNWQGEMRPCVMMENPSIPVFETGFLDGWRELSTLTDQIRIHSDCTKCNLRPICRTCAAAAKWEMGTYDGIPEYLCDYAKEYHRLLLSEEERMEE